jgi:hypothetical protein
MAYRITEAFIVSQPIANTEATQAADIPLGKIVRAIDPTYGEGEFIYLLGVASTVVGSVVTYDGASTGTPTYQTALAPSTANLASRSRWRCRRTWPASAAGTRSAATL